MTAGVDWLTPEDARILALEGPVVAGHTCKVIRLAPDGAELSLDELRSQIAGRLDRAPRLRRRLDVAAAPLAQPAWVDDQRFDIARHVLELPLGGPVDDQGLADVVAGLMRARLDRERPLWTVHLVQELTAGGAALVLRIHHALADGAAALRICACILWDEDAGGEPHAASPTVPKRADGESPRRIVHRTCDRRGRAWSTNGRRSSLLDP